MIRLKSGESIQFETDFDAFFQKLVNGIIRDALKAASSAMSRGENEDDFNRHMLREIMDNCIYVVHQIRELQKTSEDIATLLITGCLFNCTVMNLAQMGQTETGGKSESSGSGEDDDGTVH
jgi:hypothetical protein